MPTFFKYLRNAIAQRQMPKPFKRLRHPYRLVFIDDANMSELASFRLTKQTVWAGATLLFVITIVVTVLILVFSPLKYYIPGYGSGKVRNQVLQLQSNADSLSDVVALQDRQLLRLQNLITGAVEKPLQLDTTLLTEKAIEQAQISNAGPLPTAEAVEAIATPRRKGKK